MVPFGSASVASPLASSVPVAPVNQQAAADPILSATLSASSSGSALPETPPGDSDESISSDASETGMTGT